MRKLGKYIVVIVTVLALGSCAGISLVKSGEKIEIGSAMSTVPTRDWNKIIDGDVEVWTLDGPVLQQIVFVKGAEDGDYLMPIRKKGTYVLEDDIPRYEEGMTSLEVVELFEATISRMKAQNSSISNVRPHKFGNVDGFRFEFDFLTDDGLEKKGAAVGAIKNKRLYMAIYVGTKLYYFDQGKSDFENIVRTMRLT